MNMFEEIDELKKDLPRMKAVSKEMERYKFNGYQKFAIVVYIILFFFGIILGNLFPTCSSSTLYGSCVSSEFNFFLMIFVWFVSIFPCLFFFGLGHIVVLLTSINDKISK